MLRSPASANAPASANLTKAVGGEFLSQGQEYVRSVNTFEERSDAALVYEKMTARLSTFFAVVALLGHFALKEPISATHWLGIIVISLGVLTVGNTHPRTTEHK